jgi:hypothetical protein
MIPGFHLWKRGSWMENAGEQHHAGFLPVTLFPGVFRAAGTFLGVLFSRGISHRRGITHFFRGCFAPPGCYTDFPGVFRTDGVLRIFFRGCFAPTGCYTHFPGVFPSVGVLCIYFRRVRLRWGVTHVLRIVNVPQARFRLSACNG